jgi:uncharacterized protein (DUF1800 family)
MHTSKVSARPLTAALVVALALTQTALAQKPSFGQQPRKRVATPTYVSPGAPPLPNLPANRAKTLDYDQQRLLAGHLLRRIGFGPTPADIDAVLSVGQSAYIEQQLNPSQVSDAAAQRLLPKIPKSPFREDVYLQRWFTRMIYSKRQLQEKMTLIWHEHFATSLNKVGWARFMGIQEELFRTHGLGSFRQMLIDVTKDPAMLIWLDNNYNIGTVTDDAGNPVPPNENYARELLQLFSLGIPKLNMDGTPVLDGSGQAVPNYTEDDVKEVARALTGWYIKKYRTDTVGRFNRYWHDSGNKTILGETLVGREGKEGAREVEDVVDIILRQQSVAPFIATQLIQKLATETPTPGYVLRVATAFKNSSYDIKTAVRAVLTDSEFTSPAVIRSQYKEPVEFLMGAFRGLGVNSDNMRGTTYDLYMWGMQTNQLIHYPPSVFSFYRPGQKGSMMNTAQATVHDVIAEEIANSQSQGYGALWDAERMIADNDIGTPEQAVDLLVDRLLVGPVRPEVRTALIQYMGGQVTEEKFRGVAWLVLCSPDYQRN